MNSKNAILFFGIFSIFVVIAIVFLFITGGFSKKPAATQTASNQTEFPTSTDASRGSPSGFDFYSSSDATKATVSPEASSTGLSQEEYDYYYGTPAAPVYTPPPTSDHYYTKPTEQTPLTKPAPVVNPDDSPFKGELTISYVNPAYSEGDDPGNEYVVIHANESNTEKVPLTGLKIKSLMTEAAYPIGKGLGTYYRNTVSGTATIFLNPGDDAYVITGSSPIGISFESNKCIGYLSQFQDFNPGLSNSCPLIYYEGLPPKPNALSDDCLDYVARFPACYEATGDDIQSVTESLGRDCSAYVEKKANYTYCVNVHKADADFLEPVWHVYLSRDKHIWRLKHEELRLVDANGKNISDFSY